jgi:hypothetical protein
MVSLFVSLPGIASAAPFYAWVDADQPSATAEYTPAHSRSSFGTVRVKRAGTGQYIVNLGTLADVDGGNMQAQAYGDNRNFCTLAWQGDYVADKFAMVFCYTPTGEFADTKFTFTYAIYGQGPTSLENEVGYASFWFTEGDTFWTIDPNDDHTYNSTNKPITVARWFKGVFVVNFQGQAGTAPNFRVTPTLTFQQHQCKLATVAANFAGVYCFDVNGEFVDTSFTISYNDGNVFSAVREAHVAVDLNAQTQPVIEHAFNDSSTTPTTVSRVGLGLYAVTFFGTGGTNLGVPMVLANNAGDTVQLSRRCMVYAWNTTVQTRTNTLVRCFKNDGGAVDSAFSLSFVR